MARFDECLSNAPRAEGKSSSAIRSRSASLLDCNMRQPSFAPAPSDQQEEKKQRASQEISGDVNIRATKMLPAHAQSVPLAKTGLHYSLTQTKEAMRAMREAEPFPALISLVAVTRGGRCYHHWDCNTLFYCNPNNPASGRVYQPTVRVVSFDEAADYGYQRCSSCIGALQGKKTITPKANRAPVRRARSPGDQANKPVPAPTEPRVHPRDRAAARRAAAQPPQALSGPPAQVIAQDYEPEEGETSPPPEHDRDDEFSGDIQDLVADLQRCKHDKR